MKSSLNVVAHIYQQSKNKSIKKQIKAGFFSFGLEEVEKELLPWRHKRTLLIKAVVKAKKHGYFEN